MIKRLHDIHRNISHLKWLCWILIGGQPEKHLICHFLVCHHLTAMMTEVHMALIKTCLSTNEKCADWLMFCAMQGHCVHLCCWKVQETLRGELSLLICGNKTNSQVPQTDAMYCKSSGLITYLYDPTIHEALSLDFFWPVIINDARTYS